MAATHEPTEVGVLLPLRIETRYKDDGLWLRVVPDEPWFLRDDQRISEDELLALRRYADADQTAGPDGVPPAWRDLAAQLGAPRAADLHRRFVTVAPDGTPKVRTPAAEEMRTEPALPRIGHFPSELQVWLADATSGPRQVLRLSVDRDRLLADFADPEQPGDRRWWEDWDEAVAVGVAGIVPAKELPGSIDALYVTGLGEEDPSVHFGALAAEGRLGLLPPGTPTNTVSGAPAGALANDADTWWRLLTASETGDTTDADVSRALTGDARALGNLPGGDRVHRAPASALVTAVWPALWGFAAGQVFDVARGAALPRWAAGALFPEGAYPTLRVGPQPYGLLPATTWRSWEPAAGDPSFEASLVRALAQLGDRQAQSARARGTVADKDTDGLLELIADTPTSSHFRYRHTWPLELWWLATVAAGVPRPWPELHRAVSDRYPLAADLQLTTLRRYATRGNTRRVDLALVVPAGRSPEELPALLRTLGEEARNRPASFADTARVETDVLKLDKGSSLLLGLVIRSLQLLIADTRRDKERAGAFDPEPYARPRKQPGRLETLIAAAVPVEKSDPGEAAQLLLETIDALTRLGQVPAAELERMLAATVDCASHRVDPWFVALPQRRLDALTADGVARRRLGAYGWVDGVRRGTPGPTDAGLLHAPSPSSALAAAVLRDRAGSDDSGRWDLDITSRTARVADRLGEHVRAGAHLAEALGREVERIVGRPGDVEQLRRDFPVRTEHAGRRVCDGLQVLAATPFPVPVSADQQAALADLRDGLDSYGDLLVADAVHHLVEGRAEVAGAVMDAAAGLARPPELSLLRTPREGRAVTTSAVIALPHVPSVLLPAGDDARAVLSPAGTLDPSTAGYLSAVVGAPADWTFEVELTDDSAAPARQVTVSLGDLLLAPADALALTRTRLEALAVERAADLTAFDLAAPTATGGVVGGDGGERYERAAGLVGLVGRATTGPRALTENPESSDEVAAGVEPALLARYLDARAAGEALARRLDAQVSRFTTDGGLGAADPVVVRRLVAACSAWGVAPDPARQADQPAEVRLAATAALALRQLTERLTAAPDATGAAALDRADFLTAAVALVSPTGQVALTASVPAGQLPVLSRADGEGGLDDAWLPVVAAVRPPLARLEAHQLTAAAPLRPWTNRPGDPWQADATDARRLVAVYADPSLDLGGMSSTALVAVSGVDRFSEVIPAAEQYTGAAFGFDAPAARAQQAILLAVPPAEGKGLDPDTMVRILAETRTLAHARMARPVDTDDQFRALVPSGLLPAAGAVAIPLEAKQ